MSIGVPLDPQAQAEQFADLVTQSQALRDQTEAARHASATLPSHSKRIRYETTEHSTGIRLFTGPMHLTQRSTRLLVYIALATAIVASIVTLRRDQNLWLECTAGLTWLVFLFALISDHMLRAEVFFELTHEGFAVSRRVFMQQWEEYFLRDDIAYIHVGISTHALHDDAAVFDLCLYMQPHASRNMARNSVNDKIIIIESRHRDDLEWIAATLRQRLVIAAVPSDYWIKSVQHRWPSSVLRKKISQADG